MDCWLGRANARLWCCHYLCLVSLRHLDCLCREGIQLTRMNGARGKVLVFGPVAACLIPPQWWTFRPKHGLSTWVNSLGGEFIGWTICKEVHPCRSNSLVDNPQVDKSTIHRWGHQHATLMDAAAWTLLQDVHFNGIICCLYWISPSWASDENISTLRYSDWSHDTWPFQIIPHVPSNTESPYHYLIIIILK